MGVKRRTFLRLAAGVCGAGIARRGFSTAARAGRARVLIAGGGFAGAACAMQLRRLNPSIEVTLADPADRYATGPMSNSVLAGLRSLASITVSRRGLERAGVRYVRDRVASIDAERRRARLAGGARLAYDRLVMAPGIRFLWGQPQGYDEAAARLLPHAWIAGVQTGILAAQLRRMRSGGVVAVSVPAGLMRCPPGPFERASLIAAFLKLNNPRSKVLIFDANNRMPRQDAFTDAWQSQYPGMIEWIPVVQGGAVVRVAPRERVLYTAHEAHPADVINIIPPQAPASLAVQCGLASGHGWCPIDALTFESPLVPNIHVIGDACIADPMPKSGSAASAQAAQCALAIVAALDGGEPPPAHFESVCYSLLAPGMGLAIHGRFRSAEHTIEAIPDEIPAAAPPAQEARNAEAWYRKIVTDSFGAGRTAHDSG
jgi:NADPH-dependent 2,4-dienoyl-CoA reductase/sulfur reductase-like enzyme